MARGRTLRIAAGLALLFYPALVWLGLHRLEPRAIALGLLLAVLLRAWLSRRSAPGAGLWLAAAVLAAGLTLGSGSELGLLLFPVLMNLALLCLFSFSLAYPPTAIERIARVQHGSLPPAAIAWTRKVTVAWCIFFVLNGAVALFTVFLDRSWWALYNGLIAYVMMAIMFAGEWLLRPVEGRRHA